MPDVEVTLVTRWRLADLLAGVSDPRVYELIRARPKARMLLRSDLHAKYYRADNHALLGSSNLTLRGLGWVAEPNLELLVESNPATEELERFETSLLRSSVEVDDELYKETIDIFNRLQTSAARSPMVPEEASARLWLPRTRRPEALYEVYCGESRSLSRAALTVARDDLRSLALPVGLKETEFDTAVRLSLRQHVLIDRIDQYVCTPRRFGEIRALVGDILSSADLDDDPTTVWQTCMRWLLYFAPNRYGSRTPRYSEVFFRKDAPEIET